MKAKNPEICLFCKHFYQHQYGKCKAFPDGIPYSIVSGQQDHYSAISGDNGIQFEPIEERKDNSNEIE